MKRNLFSLSHYKLFTGDMGYLIPLTWFEVLPGDTIRMSTSLLLRLQALLAPIMHPVRVRIHNWYVPLNLIWDDFEDFITGGVDGDDSTTHPYVVFNGNYTTFESTLMDYLGIPPVNYSTYNENVSALPFRAYQLIYNEHYIDQQINTEATLNTNSGSDSTTDRDLQRCLWEKDYFTTCRPDESLGTDVTIPLVGDAPVRGIGKNTGVFSLSSQAARESDGTIPTYTSATSIDGTSGDNQFFVEHSTTHSGYPDIRADLSSAGAVDINDLRLAVAMQRFMENRNRYGADYDEYLALMGVKSLNSKLKKPEYLGGGRATVQFSEVLTHSTGDGSDTVGDMKGHGISGMRTRRFKKFIPEHGLIMSLMSVVPKPIYSEGLHRGLLRTTKEEYFQKELQMIGDQVVYDKELFVPQADSDDPFGYQMRYDEYKWHPSSIAGEYRSSLDYWHMARILGSAPSLNDTFVDCNPTKRFLASDSTDAMYCMASHSIQARRMLNRTGNSILR